MQALGKLVPGLRAEVFAVLHKGAHFLAQGVIIPGSATHPQNGARFREQLLTCQRIERRDQGGTGKCPEISAAFALKYEHLPLILSTRTNLPGKTAPLLAYGFPNV